MLNGCTLKSYNKITKKKIIRPQLDTDRVSQKTISDFNVKMREERFNNL